MHDPLVVAFEIKRPWPKRSSFGNGYRYWPSIVTVWHREPGGADALTVCGRKRWHLHVHHWHLQIHPLQDLRRSLLTRCAWCGGRSRKGDYVNFSHSWDGPRGHWWRGEPGLFHQDCSSVQHSHAKCFCEHPLLSQGDYGQCAFCGGGRAWRQVPDEADRLLAALPKGSRITPDIRPAVDAAWAERRARRAETSA